jgi:hypothetical protein
MSQKGIPLGQWSGSDATDALHATIKEFNKETVRQTRTMIRLTYAIAVLTFIMLLGLALQVYFALYPVSAN